MQNNHPDESKKSSKKGRRGKKDKKKRDKGSKGKRKGKGKGKKGSRKKKHEAESLEEGLYRETTPLPEFQLQELLQPTKLPQSQSDLETVLPTDVVDKTTMVMPTYKSDFTSEAPTKVSSTLPVSKVTKEVVKFISRCDPH